MKRIIALLTALLCLAAVPALGESRYATITFAASEAELTEGMLIAVFLYLPDKSET